MAAGAYDELFVAATRMKLLLNTRAKRNTVFMVWRAWRFALASGVANARLPQARQTHAHAAVMAPGLVF